MQKWIVIMATGGALFWTQQFVNDSGEPFGGVKVYHYGAGTSTAKDVWVDEGRTTPAPNPVNGDSLGRVWFYADGDYRIRVESRTGVLLYDWDNVHLTADLATMWENNRGTVYPAASTFTKGQLFARVDATEAIQDLAVNDDGTAFHTIPANLTSSARALLPVASTTGRLRRVSDSVRGVWMDTGTQWVSLNGLVVNVREFGAVGTAGTDDTAAFQAAIDAADTAGGGIVLIPPGTYEISHVVLGSNTWLRGAGAHTTTLKSTGTTLIKGIVANKNLSDGNTNLKVSDLTLHRTVNGGSGNNFNEAIYFGFSQHVWIARIRIIGAAVAGDAAGSKGIHCEGCSYIWIQDNYIYNIADNSIAVNWKSGVRTNGYAHIRNNTIELNGSSAWNHSGIIVSADHVVIQGNIMVTNFTASPTNMIELGSNVSDVRIVENIAKGTALLIATSGTEIAVQRNYIDDGAIFFDSSQGPIARLTISDNEFKTGSINVKVTAPYTVSFVLVSGNQIHASTAATALSVTNVSDATIINNVVHNSTNNAFRVPGGRAIVIGNVAFDNTGNVEGTNGFYVEGGTSTANTRTLLANNYSYRNSGFGFKFQAPQNLDFIDNEAWGNSGVGTSEFSIGTIFSLNNPLSGGTVPFGTVRMRGPGSPENWVYASPGSYFHRTDSGNASPYVKNSGTGQAGWKLIMVTTP